MFYKIDETLKECTKEEALNKKNKYVAVLTPSEWEKNRESFDMGIDLPMEIDYISETKIDVNYDSLTGTLRIPKRTNISEEFYAFTFALDEKGLVLIDADDEANMLAKKVSVTKKWRNPSLERFIYDFLETVISDDSRVLAEYEKKMNAIEDGIIAQEYDEKILLEINNIRGELLDLKSHYDQLIDVGQELEENENNFFAEENLRFFHMFTVRVERLRDNVTALREYTIQLRDLYQTGLDVKQNRIMAILTIITTIFFPLSIVTGWYGMNFTYMPELSGRYSYPILAGVCILLVITEIIIFKKKKLL